MNFPVHAISDIIHPPHFYMSGKIKFLLVSIYIIGFGILLKTLTIGKNMGILDPKGVIASEEKELIIISVLLMLVVVIPVYLLTIVFTWKYRSTNLHEKYSPTEDHNSLEEFIWWAIPCVIIVVLGSITWTSTHRLDPYRPLDSDVKPVTIQVVALNWKWLFIYPEQGIATVGYVEIPEKTPINFEITADAPMNSFWIPQLAGQIYAMSGMNTKLHVMADEVGIYKGLSANFSGDGFSEMKFTVRSVPESTFNSWVSNTKTESPNILLTDDYAQLARPSRNNTEKSFRLVKEGLYNDIIMKYMMPKMDTSEHEVMSMPMLKIESVEPDNIMRM